MVLPTLAPTRAKWRFASTPYLRGAVWTWPLISGDVVTLYGEAQRDLFGIKTHVADLVDDGRADLLVGAFYADAPNRSNAGKLYIFSAELIARLRAAGRRLDLAQRPWPEGLITVIGAERDDRLGVWMTAGDFDGDGYRDAVVGADRASGDGGGR